MPTCRKQPFRMMNWIDLHSVLRENHQMITDVKIREPLGLHLIKQSKVAHLENPLLELLEAVAEKSAPAHKQ